MFSANALLDAFPVDAERERDGVGEWVAMVALRDSFPSKEAELPCCVNEARRFVAGSPSSRAGVDERDD